MRIALGLIFVLLIAMLSSCSRSENKQNVIAKNVYLQKGHSLESVLERIRKLEVLSENELYACVGPEDFMNPRPVKSFEDLSRRYLKLELISEEEFENHKKNAVDYLIHDTLSHIKVNGKTELSFANGKKVFTDKPNDESEMVVYYYEGQLDFINRYLLYVQYYEAGCEYLLIDKSDFNNEMSIEGYPDVTPDKKHFISLSFNPYGEYLCDFELFSINNNKIESTFHVLFTNWAPSYENKWYMASDGCLYVPVIKSKYYWTSNGQMNKNFQYLKITIL